MNVRVSKLEIEGFRAFSDKVELDFPSQLVVIYGRNGRGKSTIFDSISWLFDGDLVRYQNYGREWMRVKTSHTRSLLNPKLPSKVTCHFEDIIGQSRAVLSRTENKVTPTGTSNLNGWLNNATNGATTALGAHMLCQADLHQLAKAKGKERLEALAPILDLTQTEKEISDLEQEIKDKKKTLKDLSSELQNMDDLDAKPLFDAMYLTTKQLNERVKFAGIECATQYIATNNEQELQAWLKWADDISDSLKIMRSKFANEIGQIKAKYNIAYHEQSDTLNQTYVLQVEQLVKESNENIIATRRVLAESDDWVLRLENDIIKVREYLNKRRNIGVELMSLSKANINHPKASEWNSIEVIQTNILKTKDEVELTSITLHQYESVRNTVIDSAEKILFLLSRRKTSSEAVEENESWLNNNKDILEINELQRLRNEQEKLTSESQEKIERIRQIKFHREGLCNSVNDDNCPLCGHEYESNEFLLHAIEEKTELWEEYYTSFSIHIQEMSERLAGLQKLMFEKEQRLQRITHEQIAIKAFDDELAERIQRLKDLPEWESDCELFAELGDWQSVKSVLIDLINGKISNLMGELENRNTLLNSLMEYQLTVKSQEKRIKDKQLELDEYSNILDNLLKNYGIGVLNQNDPDYEMVILEFTSLIDQAKQKQVKVHNKYESLQQYLKEAEFKWFRVLNNKLQDINDIIDMLIGFKEMIKSMEDSLQKIGRKNFNEKEINGILKWIEEAKKRKRILKKTQQDEINNAIGPLSKRIGALFENLASASNWKTIRAQAFVPDQRERTNLIFSPVLNSYIANSRHYNIDKEEEMKNSTFLFSMGEFSILGLATFLAKATEPDNMLIGNGPQLNTLFIDDPIQELDYIRDDALAYLLCDIAFERQVIVSTSNLEFANRLILSSRPIWEKYNGSCGVLYLNKEGDYKPQVQLIPPKKWIVDQGIYIPKSKIVQS